MFAAFLTLFLIFNVVFHDVKAIKVEPLGEPLRKSRPILVAAKAAKAALTYNEAAAKALKNYEAALLA
ncbi:hypothetical protein L596_026141 [Steinernema carpocapsae]|uniref:Uncharacterized protein n=1 Tax=Steinernema carpocapsae TaxID=34508 RepID=A0A4U5M0H4_STECR|nr:hypothetical protein L596_026141 [Steinernema carpocapsae]